jgi:hypothetical protein
MTIRSKQVCLPAVLDYSLQPDGVGTERRGGDRCLRAATRLRRRSRARIPVWRWLGCAGLMLSAD